MKIVALTVTTNPYVEARYNDFSNRFPDYELTVLELGRETREYMWEPSYTETAYKRIILFEGQYESISIVRRRSEIFRVLDSLEPDVMVVCGYGITGMMAASYWAKRKNDNLPLVIMSDSSYADAPRYTLKEKIKKIIVNNFQSAFVAGNPHYRYMISLGFETNNIFPGYDVVDNDFFRSASINIKKKIRPSNLTGNKFFLASSRFLPRKNILRIIDSYCIYRKSAADPWDLVILGDGSMRNEILMRVSALNLEDYVFLPGFKQYHELSSYYAWANCFILASTSEQWGLVVNEAMASGLPILVSDICGCSEDLVINGINGYLFDPKSTDDMAINMINLSSSDDLVLNKMGESSLNIISNWDLDKFSVNLKLSIDRAVQQANLSKKQVSMLEIMLFWVLSWR